MNGIFEKKLFSDGTGKWGFRSGSTRMFKLYLAHKIGFGGKTTRQELVDMFTSPKKGIFLLRHKYLREIIQSHRNLGVLNLFVPHTEEYTLPKEDFLSNAKLELPDIHSSIKNPEIIPETVILLREPSQHELNSYSIDYFQRYFWSLLFHAEVHKLQIKWGQQGRLSDMDVGLFVETLGEDTWEEIRAILVQKDMLFDPQDMREVLYEFIAYYLQFYNFAPQCLPKFFPLIQHRVKLHSQILELGIDEEALLEHSRPEPYISTEELVSFRDLQIEDPAHDLDLFKPAYYMERINNSPSIEWFGMSKREFRERYGEFVVNKLLPMVILDSRLIGRLTFEDVIDKARLQCVDWNGEKLLLFDAILADGLYSLYQKANWLDRLLTKWRGVVCLQDIKYRENKEKITRNSILALAQKKEKIERKAGKRSWFWYISLPITAPFSLLLLIFKVAVWLPKTAIYLMAEKLEPYFLCAQRIANRKRKKIFASVLKKATIYGNRGDMVGAVINYKKAFILAQKIYLKIEASSEDRKLYKTLDTELQHKLDYIESKFAEEHSLSQDAREKLSDLFQYLKEVRILKNAHKRLLQDIQKSYIDPNKEYFRISLLKWLLSFGFYPLSSKLKALPLKKKLRSLKAIEKRLWKLRVREKELKSFQFIIQQAHKSIEAEARTRLGDLVDKAMAESKIVPEGNGRGSQQERIAYEKIKNRLVDLFVEKGHLQFSDLRDVISRNDLKLNDITGLKEFVSRDQLLKFDRNISQAISGVHRPAEIYMRSIHRLNALLFGSSIGRWLCRYILLPFGGAYLLLELFCVILHTAHVPETILLIPFQPFYQWILPYVEPLITMLHPAFPALKGIQVSPELLQAGSGVASSLYRYTLEGSLLAIFKISWSFCAGMTLLFFIYTEIGRKLWHLIWQWTRRVLRLLFIEIPRGIWYFRPVQILYKLSLWRYLNIFIVRPALYSLPITVPVLYYTDIGNIVGPYKFTALGIALACGFINTRLGRGLVDYFEEFLVALILRINSALFVNLFNFVMEGFRVLVRWLEQVLYAVDDFFRFRKGDNFPVQIFKAVMGNIWYLFNYVTRFTINLIVEPQINPIKHFPVVTISHKILLPLSIFVSESSKVFLEAKFGSGLETGLGMGLVFFFVQLGLPGICGFVAWELKENWKLYHHARSRKVKPEIVGSHGEKLPGLLVPGFHSGTIPKLYRKMRQSAEFFYKTGNRMPLRKLEYKYRRICEDICRFVRRNLRAEFINNPEMTGVIGFEISEIAVYSRKIVIPIEIKTKDAGLFAFDINYELKDWLICAYLTIQKPMDLPPEIENYLNFAITVFWKKSSVDIVEAQIHRYFRKELDIDIEQYRIHYQFDGRTIKTSLRPRCALDIAIDLEFHLGYEKIQPRVIKSPENRTLQVKSIDREKLVFRCVQIPWDTYNQVIAEYNREGSMIPEKFLLPIFPAK